MIFISEKNLKVKKMSLASKSLRILLCLCETIGVMAVGYVLYIFLQQFLMIALKSACYELRNGIKNGEIYEILFLILGIMLIVSIFIIFSYTISKKWSSKYIIRQKNILEEKNRAIDYFQVVKNVINTYLTMMLGSIILNIVSSMMYSTHGTNNQQALSEMFANGNYQLLYVVILSLIIAPIIEEILIRFTTLGFLRHKLMNIWCHGVNKSSEVLKNVLNVALWLFSSVCFSLLHRPASLFPFLQYFWMGICFGYVYLKFDDVRASITIHTLNNAIALLQMMFIIG